mmetsp:Transcript_55205/g.115482  ORF Transcript_55205/g.115482 Transcript_55205/m.115482 type:complete len:286 (+) Transcript_55205:3879-4736(+)
MNKLALTNSLVQIHINIYGVRFGLNASIGIAPKPLSFDKPISVHAIKAPTPRSSQIRPTSGGVQILVESIVQFSVPTRTWGHHLSTIPGAAYTYILPMSALVVAPRSMSTPIQITLEPEAHHVVQPDRPHSVLVSRTATPSALRCAHLLEHSSRKPHQPAESCCIRIGEAIITHRPPRVVALHLQSADHLVAIDEAHVGCVNGRASRESTRPDPLADLPIRLSTVAAQASIVPVLASHFTPRSMLAIAHITLILHAGHIVQPYDTLPSSVLRDRLSAQSETEGLA